MIFNQVQVLKDQIPIQNLKVIEVMVVANQINKYSVNNLVQVHLKNQILKDLLINKILILSLNLDQNLNQEVYHINRNQQKIALNNHLGLNQIHKNQSLNLSLNQDQDPNQDQDQEAKMMKGNHHKNLSLNQDQDQNQDQNQYQEAKTGVIVSHKNKVGTKVR